MKYRLRSIRFKDGKMETEENHEWEFAAVVAGPSVASGITYVLVLEVLR